MGFEEIERELEREQEDEKESGCEAIATREGVAVGDFRPLFFSDLELRVLTFSA